MDIGITVKERHTDYYKISVRTTDKLNAAEFCQQFGGGGHPQASGITMKGTLEEAADRVLRAMEEKVKQNQE